MERSSSMFPPIQFSTFPIVIVLLLFLNLEFHQLLVWQLVAFLHKQQTLLSSLKFFCNNQTKNSLPLIGNGSFSNLSTIESLSCSQLYSKVNSSFSHKIWGGNRLLIEPHYSFGMCNCCSITSLP